MTKEKLAQWVIDNRWPKNENEKVSDSEMYNTIIDTMGQDSIRDYDFWVDATTFIKTIVNENAQQMIMEHIKEKRFNGNEARFFREYLNKAFDMYPMMAILKNSI